MFINSTWCNESLYQLLIFFDILGFSLPARPCLHPADELTEEMYLLTYVNLARQGTPVNETSFTVNELMEKSICFDSVNNTTIE